MIKKLDNIIPLICSFFLLAISLIAMGREATPEQRGYMRARTKLVARDTNTIDGYVVNTFRKGNRTWCTTNKLAQANISLKWKVSKLKLITTLKGIDKWITVKGFISDADLEDEWNACQYIDVRYPAFISATNQAVRAGLATSEEISTVIEQSWDDE